MNNNLKKLTYSAVLICAGILLPFLTVSNQQLGNMFCLMHIPVLLCGYICGWQWGLAVGAVTPLLRSFTVGMPPIFPIAVTMAFELSAYGLLCGLFYKLFPKKNVFIYISLLLSMIGGRIVWGIVKFAVSGFSGGEFGLAVFITDGFVTAVPGIILQIIVVPVAVMVLKRTKLFLNQ